MDDNQLITFLEGLTPADLTRILARIPEANNQIPEGTPHLQRVSALLNYVRSSAGPGQKKLEEVVQELFPAQSKELFSAPGAGGVADKSKPASTGKATGIEAKPARVGIFLVLLGVVVTLMVLFASGILRYGMEGPFVYLLYIIAGLLVAALCYGLLDSTGQFEGERAGATIKLGGAVVALVVVAGGGALYEKNVHASPFSVRFSFHAGAPTEPVKGMKGSLTLRLGAARLLEPITPESTVLFQDLDRRWAGTDVDYTFDSETHSLVKPPAKLILKPDSTLALEVAPRSPYGPESESNVELNMVDIQSWKIGANPFRSIDIKLRAVLKSKQSIPIAPKGVLQIRKNGVPIRDIPLEVASGTLTDGAILSPNEPTTILLQGKLTKTELDLMTGTFDFWIGLRYEGSSEPRYFTDPQTFSRQTIRFEGG